MKVYIYHVKFQQETKVIPHIIFSGKSQEVPNPYIWYNSVCVLLTLAFSTSVGNLRTAQQPSIFSTQKFYVLLVLGHVEYWLLLLPPRRNTYNSVHILLTVTSSILSRRECTKEPWVHKPSEILTKNKSYSKYTYFHKKLKSSNSIYKSIFYLE